MCGIAGAWSQSQEASGQAVQAMVRHEAHRGPDDEGFATPATAPGLVLGHRRLAILDLSAAGHQPMQHPGTGDWVVLNGEVYNFAELRKELEALGAQFTSSSDTEVVLHAFERWGEGCFARFRGMFALGLFDASERRLLLARDPLGIKPLYVAETARGLLFASELRALAAAGWTGGEPDPAALAGLLAYGSVPAPLTVLKGVRMHPPGVWSSWRASEGRIARDKTERFWHFPTPAPLAPSWESARVQLRERLQSAVQAHLVSDVPVGLFLSGGIDSSAIAAIASKLRWGDLQTFTVGTEASGPEDERARARATALAIGARHTEVVLGEAEALRSLESWLERGDQPSVDGLNTFIISGAVRARGVKVALSGLGGDELFGGYASFRDVPRLLRWARATALVPKAWKRAAARGLLSRSGEARRRKALDLGSAAPEGVRRARGRRRLFADSELTTMGFGASSLALDEDWLTPQAERGLGLVADDPLASVRVLESRFYMGNTLLRDSDVCSMAHGLELRVPLLDTPLLDFAFALPGAFAAPRSGQHKALLVDATRDLLPRELFARPKQGFSLPYARWMMGPLRERFEAHWQGLAQSGLIEGSEVTRVRAELFVDPEGPSWSRAWMLGVLGAWWSRRPRAQERAA